MDFSVSRRTEECRALWTWTFDWKRGLAFHEMLNISISNVLLCQADLQASHQCLSCLSLPGSFQSAPRTHAGWASEGASLEFFSLHPPLPLFWNTPSFLPLSQPIRRGGGGGLSCGGKNIRTLTENKTGISDGPVCCKASRICGVITERRSEDLS